MRKSQKQIKMDRANEERFNRAVEEAREIVEGTGDIAFVTTIVANPYRNLRTYQAINHEQRIANSGYFHYASLTHMIRKDGSVKNLI